ncbi:hypothetical protein ACRYCC_07365 [Actinomadura scrupuli]
MFLLRRRGPRAGPHVFLSGLGHLVDMHATGGGVDHGVSLFPQVKE